MEQKTKDAIRQRLKDAFGTENALMVRHRNQVYSPPQWVPANGYVLKTKLVNIGMLIDANQTQFIANFLNYAQADIQTLLEENDVTDLALLKAIKDTAEAEEKLEQAEKAITVLVSQIADLKLATQHDQKDPDSSYIELAQKVEKYQAALELANKSNKEYQQQAISLHQKNAELLQEIEYLQKENAELEA